MRTSPMQWDACLNSGITLAVVENPGKMEKISLVNLRTLLCRHWKAEKGQVGRCGQAGGVSGMAGQAQVNQQQTKTF